MYLSRTITVVAGALNIKGMKGSVQKKRALSFLALNQYY